MKAKSVFLAMVFMFSILLTATSRAAICSDDASFWCVEKGDRGLTIAANNSVPWEEFVKMNRGIDLESIKPDQRLRIVSREKILGKQQTEKLQKKMMAELAREKERSGSRINQLQAEIKSLKEELKAKPEERISKNNNPTSEVVSKKDWTLDWVFFSALILLSLVVWHQFFLKRRKKMKILLRINGESYFMQRHSVDWAGRLLAIHKKDGKRKMAYSLNRKELYAKSIASSLRRDENLFSLYLRAGWIKKKDDNNKNVFYIEERSA